MKLFVLAFPVCLAAAQAAHFNIGDQKFQIVPAFERQMNYVAAARERARADRGALYAKLVSGPVFDECAAGGEYAELGRFNVAAPIADLDALAAEIDVLRKGVAALEEGLRKASAMLPGPDTKVCLLAADPAAAYIKTDLRGVAGTTVGAGKIWLQINPIPGWEDWVRYTVAHEYHHSAWTARYYDKLAPDRLLEYLVFEGRADAFAHLAYPGLDVPWDRALSGQQAAQVWKTMRGILETTDFRVKRAMMFGSPDVPHWAGYTIGFEIVESYRKRHPDASIASWTAATPQTILDGSDFSLPLGHGAWPARSIAPGPPQLALSGPDDFGAAAAGGRGSLWIGRR